jgi:hypothetical protein
MSGRGRGRSAAGPARAAHRARAPSLLPRARNVSSATTARPPAVGGRCHARWAPRPLGLGVVVRSGSRKVRCEASFPARNGASASRTPRPSLPYKVDTSRPSLRTNWTRLARQGSGDAATLGAGAVPGRPSSSSATYGAGARKTSSLSANERRPRYLRSGRRAAGSGVISPGGRLSRLARCFTLSTQRRGAAGRAEGVARRPGAQRTYLHQNIPRLQNAFGAASRTHLPRHTDELWQWRFERRDCRRTE